MLTNREFIGTSAALAAISVSQSAPDQTQAQGKQPTMKMTTPIPPEITIPDSGFRRNPAWLISPSGAVCRPHSQRGQAWRPSRASGNQVRAGY